MYDQRIERRVSIGDRRTEAAHYLRESRKSFYDNISLEKALDCSGRALEIMGVVNQTHTMLAWHIFLLICADDKAYKKWIKKITLNQRTMPLFLWSLYKEGKIKQAILLFDEHKANICDDEKRRFWNYLNVYFYALLLYKRGQTENAFAILTKFIKDLQARPLPERIRLLVAKAYYLLGDYYQRRGKVTLAEAMMKKAFQIVETTRLYFLSAEVYLKIAEFYNTHFPQNKGLKILERVSQILEYAADQKAFLDNELAWAYNFLYKGDSENFWMRIKNVQKNAERYHYTNNLANSFILEALFHLYNKDAQKADRHVLKAFEYAENEELKKKSQRLSVIIPLFLGKGEEMERRYSDFGFKFEEYGFERLLNLHYTTDRDEILGYFKICDKNKELWYEETCLSYCEKLTETIPEIFQNSLKKYIARLNITTQTLSLAICYEALGRSYIYQKRVNEAEELLRNALSLYKKTGFFNAAKVLDEITPGLAENLKELRNSVEESMEKNGNEDEVKTFQDCKVLCNRNIKRLKSYEEIMSFARNIEISDDLEETLKQILYWFCSLVKVQSGTVLLLKETENISRVDLEFKKKGSRKPLEEIVNSSNCFKTEPLEIKRTYIIDANQSLIIYLKNDQSPLIVPERKERLEYVLSEIEPVIGLLIKNALFFRTSMFDGLTKLYSRWYYQERLKEEFDKALRYEMPICYIMGDLDSFKSINDTYGHSTGDEVLKEVAGVFLKSTRRFDIVSRYGGEEFALILPNTKGGEGFKVAEKIRRAIASINLFPFQVTMSFGLDSMVAGEYGLPSQLEINADKALYISKNNGKNRTTVFQKNSLNPLEAGNDFDLDI